MRRCRGVSSVVIVVGKDGGEVVSVWLDNGAK